MSDLPTTQFSYADLSVRDVSVCVRVRSAADAIRAALGRGLDATMEVGRQLLAVRADLQHGEWLAWLHQECTLSETTARRYINCWERWGGADRSRVPDLPLRVLYSLAADSTPEAAVAEVLERQEAGEAMTSAKVKEVVQRKKKPEEQPTAPEPEQAAGAVDLPRLHQKLAGIAEIAADIEAARKDARSLIRLYTRDPELQLAAAGLVGLVEQLDDVATYVQRQLWPEGECPACRGLRATAEGECKPCRGGGWSTKQQMNGAKR